MWRTLILAAGLFACLIPAGTVAQEYRKTVTVEVYAPEGARLYRGSGVEVHGGDAPLRIAAAVSAA